MDGSLETVNEARRLNVVQTVVDRPWLAVIALAVLGICLGLCISCFRRCVRRGRPHGEERPWECIELAASCCNAAAQRKQAGPNGFIFCMIMTRASCVMALSLLTLGASAADMAIAIMLRVRLQDMQGNMVGDPERRLVDECMRDFEGLPLESEIYQTNKRSCIEKLNEDDSLRRLPVIRLTVDERVCSPQYLCAGAPSECRDTGEPLDADYKPGAVSQCYELIRESKAARNLSRRTWVLAEVETRCMGSGSWLDYDNHVLLRYCMWKHQFTGLCMNSQRTNCPQDSSCCPVAENYRGGGTGQRLVRPNQYECKKSPLVGLFCQHIDYRVEGSGNLSDRPFCTEDTCDSFAWCRDMADIPDLCIGESCRLYERSLDLAVVIVVWVSSAMTLDIAYIIMLLRCPEAPRWKCRANFAAACFKLLVWGFCVAGGVKDFVDAALRNACFNTAGMESVSQASIYVDVLRILSLVTLAGSVLLSPLSMRYGNQLVGLPYARSRQQPP